jgi:hypothetical protein
VTCLWTNVYGESANEYSYILYSKSANEYSYILYSKSANEYSYILLSLLVLRNIF